MTSLRELRALNERVERARAEAAGSSLEILQVQGRLRQLALHAGVRISPPLDDLPPRLRSAWTPRAVALPDDEAAESHAWTSLPASPRTPSPLPRFVDRPPAPPPSADRGGATAAHERDGASSASQTDEARPALRECAASPLGMCARLPRSASPCATATMSRAAGGSDRADVGGGAAAATARPSPPSRDRGGRHWIDADSDGSEDSSADSAFDSSSDSEPDARTPSARARRRLGARDGGARASVSAAILSSWRARELERVLLTVGVGEEELAYALLTLGTAEHAEYAQLSSTDLSLLAAVAPSAAELRAARRRLDALCAELSARETRAGAREALRTLSRAERYVCALTRVPCARQRVLCFAFATSFPPNASHARALVRRLAHAARVARASAWLRALLDAILGEAPEGQPADRRVLERAAAGALDAAAAARVRGLCAGADGLRALGEAERLVADGRLAGTGCAAGAAGPSALRGSAADASPPPPPGAGAGAGAEGGALPALLSRLEDGSAQLSRAISRYTRRVSAEQRHPDDAFLLVLRPFAARAQRELSQLRLELEGALGECADAMAELLGETPGCRLDSGRSLFLALADALAVARASLAAGEGRARGES
jgi:hypothetical protein